MHTLKLTSVGNSTGLILPREVLAKLRLGKGETVYLTETPDGFMITPYDEEFAKQMEQAETIMREDRDVLKALAER